MPTLPRRVRTWLEGLRFPVLLLVTGALFVVSVFVPDPLPFVDETLLALGTILLARLKRRRASSADDEDASGGGKGGDASAGV